MNTSQTRRRLDKIEAAPGNQENQGDMFVVYLPHNHRECFSEDNSGNVRIYRTDLIETIKIDQTMSAEDISRRVKIIKERFLPVGDYMTWICIEQGDRERYLSGKPDQSGRVYDPDINNLFIIIERASVDTKQDEPFILMQEQAETVLQEPVEPDKPAEQPARTKRSPERIPGFQADVNRWFSGGRL